MSAPLVFIHGWGFNGSMWHEISAHLPRRNSLRLELGYVGSPIASPPEIPDNAIIVAHSLGVLWALKHLPINPAGFISVCGFDQFSPPVRRADLLIMKRGLNKNPMAQMMHFWRSCGSEPFAKANQLNQSALIEGLHGLMNWDGRKERQKLPCPMQILASRDDQIVSKQMSCDMWGEESIVWSKSGGHALPLTRPKWCADQIKTFVKNHE